MGNKQGKPKDKPTRRGSKRPGHSRNPSNDESNLDTSAREVVCTPSRSDSRTSFEACTSSRQEQASLSLLIQSGDLSRQSSSSPSTTSPQSSSSVQSTSSPTWLLTRQQSVNAQAAMDVGSPPLKTGRYEATSATERFCLLARLLLDVCSDAVRDLLRCKIKGGEVILTQEIYKKRNKLNQLRQLHDAQKKIILPPQNQIVRYNSLDYTLMYTVIRNVCPYKIEPEERKQNCWGKKPMDSDSSLLAALERIRFCRNDFFAHATSAEVNTADFVELWEQVEKALQKIDENLDPGVVSICYVDEMKKLENTSSDPKTVTLLKRMAEIEKQLMDAYEMAVETDVRLGELLSVRKKYRKTIWGSIKTKLCTRSYKQEDANIGQTEHYLARFVKENEFYIETRVFQQVEEFLKQNKCAIIVGQPGAGKTEIAVHLMFKYVKNFVVRKVDSPYEFKSLVDPTKKHLIFIDNIFDCSDNTLTDWWKSFDFIEELVQHQDPDSDQEDSDSPEYITYVVMTTRPYALEAAKKKMSRNHPLLKRYVLNIDSIDFKLSDIEKRQILEAKIRYASHVKKMTEYVFRDDDWKVIYQSSPPFGFPLCARLFACDEGNRRDGIAFFSNPHRDLKNRLKEIIENDITRHIEILFILLLVSEVQCLTLNFNDDDHCWGVLFELGITEELSLRQEMVKNLPDAATGLQEVYLRQSGFEYKFIHPSVHEAVENYFIEKYTNKAIEILPVHILFQKMHMEDSVDECVPALDPRFHDILAQRLLKEVLDEKNFEVLNYRELKHKNFSNVFLNHIVKDENTLKEVLKLKHTDGLPFMYCFTSSITHNAVIELLKHETMSKACTDSELFGHYAHSLIASCASAEKLDITEFILDHYSGKDIQNFFAQFSLSEESNENFASPLLEASRARNEVAIRLLIEEKAEFSQTTWRGWQFLHACWNEPQICCSEILESILAFDRQRRLSDNNETADALKYDQIQASGEKTFFEDVVSKIDECVRKHDSFQMILFHLIQIPTLEITNELIEAFCFLAKLEGISEVKGQNPLNIADDDGNNILHLFLKNRVYRANTIQSSDGDDSIHSEDDAEKNAENYDKAMFPEEKTDDVAYERMENKNILLQTIGRLCVKGLDINMKNKKEETPLMIEISKFSPSIVVIESLLHHRANPDAQDKFGRTCLHILLLQNYDESVAIETILAVLIKYRANVNLRDGYGNNPLFVELKRQKPREVILNCLIDAQIDMNARDQLGRTVLHFAISSSYDSEVAKRVVEILLKSEYLEVLSCDETGVSAYRLALEDSQYHDNVLITIAQHQSCSFPLHKCINENIDEEIKIHALKNLRSIDDKKFRISATDENDQTLLIVASRVCPQMDKLFQFLLTWDIDINVKDKYGNSALFYLIESNEEFEKRDPAFNLLLAKEPSVHERDDDANSRSPLSRAMQSIMSKSNILEVVDPLFPSEAITKNILDESPKDRFADHLQSDGVFDLKVDTVQRMLNLTTVDLNFTVDAKQRTYLHYCASSRLADKHTRAICERLIELNVEVDRKDKDGLTCIDMAFKHSGKKFETLVFLLKKSKKLKELDIDKLLEYLADGNFLYVDLIQYLIEHVFNRTEPKRNLFHYLASVGYDPKDQAKAEREEVFDVLNEYFRIDKENESGQIPLHIAAEGDASVSCVRNFVRISSEFLNKPDSEKYTALHLVLKSNRDDNDVFAIVRKMLKFCVDINAQNEMLKTPLMLAVKCAKDRADTISELLKKRPNLLLKDRSGFTILHYCMDTPKDDFKAHAVLSLFLDSGLPVPVKVKSGKGLTALNLAASNCRKSRVLCILKMLQIKDCSAATVDDGGQSPLYNTALALKGMNPLVTLERLIRAYIFLNHGDSDFETNKRDKVSDVCKRSKFISLRDLLDTNVTNPEETYAIIKRAWIDVSSRPLHFDKNEYRYDQVLEFGQEFMDEKMKSLILDSLPYLSHRKLDDLTNDELVDDESTLSSVPDLEH